MANAILYKNIQIDEGIKPAHSVPFSGSFSGKSVHEIETCYLRASLFNTIRGNSTCGMLEFRINRFANKQSSGTATVDFDSSSIIYVNANTTLTNISLIIPLYLQNSSSVVLISYGYISGDGSFKPFSSVSITEKYSDTVAYARYGNFYGNFSIDLDMEFNIYVY